MIEIVGGVVPRIYFATGNAHLLREIADLPAEVVGLDWRQRLADAAAALGAGKALQGNLDPAMLVGAPESLESAAQRLVQEGKSLGGHIFNLGHGVPPQTDPGRLGRLVDLVHETGRRGEGS
jgi:uroporphyrinogen decarboxylase